MAQYTVNVAGFTPAQQAAVASAAKFAAPGNSVNIVGGSPASSSPPPAPASAPTTGSGPAVSQTSLGTLTTMSKSTIPAPVQPVTYFYGVDRKGAPIYESSVPGAALDIPNAVPAPGTPLPTSTTPSRTLPAPVFGLPSYPTAAPAAAPSPISQSYSALLSSIDAIQGKILSATTPSDEEQRLAKELATKKDELSKFDIGSIQATEDLYGTGRGRTLGTIGLENTQVQRSRALERFGLAQEADTITNQLGMAQSDRQQRGALAQTEYELATKKLDIAMNVESHMEKVHQDEQNNARQYLLDVVGFVQGKTFEQLDPQTQAAITNAVADSPITLGMVKTALASAAASAQAQAQGRQFQVAGVGIVQVAADGSGYKVVVPASGKTSTGTSAPTFEQYVAQQNLPLPSMTQERIAQLRTEYDTKYPGAAGGVGAKFSSTQFNNGVQNAGVTADAFRGLPYDVQNFYVSAPQAQINTVHDTLAQVAAGSMTPTAAGAWVNSSQITPTMKTYLLRKIGEVSAGVAPKSGSGGGIISALGTGWHAVTNFFGI